MAAPGSHCGHRTRSRYAALPAIVELPRTLVGRRTAMGKRARAGRASGGLVQIAQAMDADAKRLRELRVREADEATKDDHLLG